MIYKKDLTFVLKISNSYTGELIPSADGLFLSSKKDTGSQHGIGLSSVRQTVEKYSGDVWFDTAVGEDGTGIFTVNAILMEDEN